MEKIINIGGKPCRLKTSAALPREYRNRFQRDIFEDFNLIVQADAPDATKEMEFRAADLAEEITFAMHKYGDPTQPEKLMDWLEQFDTADAVYNAWPEVVALWINETKTTIEPQKKRDRQREK